MMLAFENIFITGDGKTVFIVSESMLKDFEKIGFREATEKETLDYYAPIIKRQTDFETFIKDKFKDTILITT